jgi:hypothetical protein
MSQQNKTGQSATATDEIIALKKNCRFVFVTEPDSAIEIETSHIASCSRGDPLQCRENYGHSFNFVPEFNLFLRPNSDLSFSESNTVAMTRRLLIFSENPENENQGGSL